MTKGEIYNFIYCYACDIAANEYGYSNFTEMFNMNYIDDLTMKSIYDRISVLVRLAYDIPQKSPET